MGTGAYSAEATDGTRPIKIGQRLELFTSRFLIERMDGLALRLHEPGSLPLPKSPLPVAYTTVIKDGAIAL